MEPNTKDWLQLAIEEHHIDVFDFEKEFNDPTFIAKGGYGNIFMTTGKKRNKTYALKYLGTQPGYVESDRSGYAALVKELKCLRRVDDEDFVARCYGIARDPKTNEYIIVMKYAEQGSLNRYLLKNAGKLDWIKKMTLAYQISEALEYIHDRGLIHRDLHSGNILINGDGRPIIADFGLSKISILTTSTSTLSVGGHIQWVPSELIKDLTVKYDTRGDIYSLGVIFWEISADGRIPFATVGNIALIYISIIQGKREVPVNGTPKEYITLYSECWDDEPERRPKLLKIKERLTKMIIQVNSSNKLTKAIITPYKEVVAELRENPNARDKDRRMLLHQAIENGQFEVAKLLSVQLGADINAMDNDGQTLLHQAVVKGNFEVVKLLVAELGADARVKNNIGQMPLDEAVANGHTEIVRWLNLRGIIPDREACSLSEFLKYPTIFTKLNLRGNDIGDSDASALGESLKQNTTLTQLNLFWNDIGDSGASALGESLKQNTTLTQLNLGGNHIGDSGAHALGESLKQNTTLTELDLGNNNIGDSGASALGESLKQNTTLTQLNLGGNQIGYELWCKVERRAT